MNDEMMTYMRDSLQYSNPNPSYTILTNYNHTKLETVVIRYMKEGWIPLGGIGVGSQMNPPILYQAMVRK